MIQLAGGVFNIILKAPVWMQMFHLLMADAILILLVIVTLETFRRKPLPEVGAAKALRLSDAVN